MNLFNLSRFIRTYKKGRRLVGSSEYTRVEKLNKVEEAKRPDRTQIINFILSGMSGETCYLEIGVRNPDDNFNKINASKKFSVDPGVEYDANPVDFPYTSDDFFSLMDKAEILPKQQFDLIFIDGLHLAEQVDRDISNALRHLKTSGFIVMHDCNPPSEWHAREHYEFHHSPAGGTWNGTTWKSFVKWRYHDEAFSCCVDSDWGIGIISKTIDLGPKPSETNEFYEFHVLERNRKDQLNLITFENFKSMIERTSEN